MPMRVWPNLPIFASVFAVSLALAPLVFGQSGLRNAAGPAATAASGSSSRVPADSSSGPAPDLPVGLQGYCSVCLVEMRQWIKGDSRLALKFDGKKYLFPGNEQAELFEKDPLKYVPVLRGDDIVLFARTGKRIEGTLNFGVTHKGRIYFFASDENRQLFQARPESYENVDLALGGECIVCRVDMKQRVPGRPEFTALYKGVRYQFPGEEQQTAFLKSPARYLETVTPRLGLTPAGAGSRPLSAPQQSASGSETR